MKHPRDLQAGRRRAEAFRHREGEQAPGLVEDAEPLLRLGWKVRNDQRPREVATVTTRASPSRAITSARDQSAFGVAIANSTAASASTSTAM